MAEPATGCVQNQQRPQVTADVGHALIKVRATPGARLPLATTNSAEAAVCRSCSRHWACSANVSRGSGSTKRYCLPRAALVDGEALSC